MFDRLELLTALYNLLNKKVMKCHVIIKFNSKKKSKP